MEMHHTAILISLGTIMVHTTLLCIARLAGQLFLWKEMVIAFLPRISSLISWNSNTLSTRTQRGTIKRLNQGRQPSVINHLPFGTSSKNTWSCVLLFHWENWLTSYPFLHYSPIVTVIANFFVSKIDAATLYFYFSLLYYLLYFIIDFSHIDFSLNVFSEDK